MQVAQDATVFAQDIVDGPHIPVGVAVESVVVHAPALVGTELLVGTAHHGRAAFQAILDAVLFYHAGEFISKPRRLQVNPLTENLMIFTDLFKNG